MADPVLKRGTSYLSTYILLVKDYVGYLWPKSIPILSGVIAARLIYPLPFAIMIAAVYAMMAGHHSSVMKFQDWSVVVSVDTAFLCALALAVLSLSFSYFMARVALTANTSWQTSLFWRSINRLPVIARWDAETPIPLPLAVGRLGAFFTGTVRSGFLIGRIVEIGFPDLGIAIGALLVLAWLDPLSVSVLIGVAALMLPAYGWALLRVVGLREGSARSRQEQRIMFQQVLERSVLAPSARRIDVPGLSRPEKERFSSGYSIVNDQLIGLNLIGLIVGLHVFLSIAVIYVVNGATLSEFVKDKVFFFVVLIFMMRSALSVTLLMGRLSRSYTGLAVLRAFLYPKRKRARRVPGAPAEAVLALQAKQGERHYLFKGKPAFVVMPQASYAFELLPLSNALQVLETPKTTALRHIVFLDRPALESALDGTVPRVPVAEIKISAKQQSIRLPVCQATPDLDRLFVVALSVRAWEFLVSSGQADAFCAERIVFVVVAEPIRPEPPSRDTLLVVSDCVDIIAMGEFAKTWENSAEEGFQRAAKKDPLTEPEQDEEMV